MADEEIVRTVVLPVDNDDKSKLAVDWYCKKLHKEGDNVFIVHVFIRPEMYDVNIPWPAVKTLCEDWNYLNSVAEEKATKLLEQCQNMCTENSITAKTESLSISFEDSDKIGMNICKFAQDKKANQIVMNYSRKGDMNAKLGSMSSYCVARAGVPVEVLYL